MNAATKIQASFRGHMARKQAEKSKNDGEISKEMEKLQSKVTQVDNRLHAGCVFLYNQGSNQLEPSGQRRGTGCGFE